MNWRKHGHIFGVDGSDPFMATYASPLSVLPLSDRLRIYFTSRSVSDNDGNFISRIFFVELDRNNSRHVLDLHRVPLIECGKPGSFDEFGTMVAEVVPVSDRTAYLYYMGWQRARSVPYFINCGTAVSQDGGRTFTKPWEGPTFGITKEDPYGIGNISVLNDRGNWKMWYTSYTEWLPPADAGGRYSPQYRLKYATSPDGINWERTNRICLAPQFSGEAIATPCVLAHEGLFHMWFSHRAGDDYHDGRGSYRIGYAVSADGLEWVRNDAWGGLPPSSEGWDSLMTAYPRVLLEGDRLTMFYNGNHFGRDGFGYATCCASELGSARTLLGN